MSPRGSTAAPREEEALSPAIRALILSFGRTGTLPARPQRKKASKRPAAPSEERDPE